MPRKLPAAKLDALTPEQREMIVDMSEGVNGQAKHTLAALVKFLASEFDVSMSDTRLSAWLTRQRGEREFDALLDKTRIADQRATAIAGGVGKAANLTHSNVVLLGGALQRALLADDSKAIMAASKALAMVLGAFAGDKKADASVESARAATTKLQITSCELFVKWVADTAARKIATSNLSNVDKIAKLRSKFFADVDALDEAGEVRLPE